MKKKSKKAEFSCVQLILRGSPRREYLAQRIQRVINCMQPRTSVRRFTEAALEQFLIEKELEIFGRQEAEKILSEYRSLE